MRLSQYEAHYGAFLDRYPEFRSTTHVDDLRETEYRRLDANQQIYLDYTGGGLYAQSQLDEHFEMLKGGVWGNPHSQNPTSLAMTERVEQARSYVLSYFNADPQEYDVIFTANASGALKIIGESFPFTENSRYVLLRDNHNSVNGIREYARAKGADVTYVTTTPPEMRVEDDHLLRELDRIDSRCLNLFAYPAQSNYTGVKHDLAWIETAQDRGWLVLLDAAAYAPTNRLDLSQHHPDFVSLSFYKIFGYPTGLGCLIARKSALARLVRPWFAGGTITIASAYRNNWYYLIEGHSAFEEGTVNYLNIPAVEIGLRFIESVGIEHITTRVHALTGWLLEQMQARRHSNGQPLVEIHGPRTNQQRGGTISFNLNDPDGKRLDYRHIEQQANQVGISLRTGCFCNPGSGETVHDLQENEMQVAFSFDTGPSFHELYEMASEQFQKYPSAIRISVGIATNFADVHALMTFLEQFIDKSAATTTTITPAAPHKPDTA